MAIHKATLVWDSDKHSIVHLAMTNKNQYDAAFLRTCVEFYQMSQAGANVQQLVLERLARIENMLRSGVVMAAPDDVSIDGNDQTDEIFDDLLEQIE
jgi:hypothetical protein